MNKRTLRDVQRFMTANRLVPGQSLQPIYGALRVFYTKREIKEANIQPTFFPPLLPKDTELYNKLMQHSYTVEEFLDWFTLKTNKYDRQTI